jgi:hypothetical protein
MQLNDQTSVRDLPKHRVMKVKITNLENIVLMHACNFNGPRILQYAVLKVDKKRWGGLWSGQPVTAEPGVRSTPA